MEPHLQINHVDGYLLSYGGGRIAWLTPWQTFCYKMGWVDIWWLVDDVKLKYARLRLGDMKADRDLALRRRQHTEKLKAR